METLEIIRLYSEENKSPQEIAEIYNTYPNKIRRLLIKHGHQLKSRSEAQKIALSAGRREHPTAGKQRSELEKQKISKSVSNRWKQIDEKEKQRRSSISKERWAEMSSEQKEKMKKSAIDAIRNAGKFGSKIENFFAKEIAKHYRIEYHKKNLIPNEKLEIDFYIPELQTVIEVDGPSHFLPIWGEEKLNKQIKADLDKNGLILGKGYTIIRVKILNRVPIARRNEIVVEILKYLDVIANKQPCSNFIEIEA